MVARLMYRAGWLSAAVGSSDRLDLLLLQRRLHRVFGHIGDLEILALRLKTGTEVALVTHWWPDSGDVALLQRDPHLTPEESRNLCQEYCALMRPNGLTLDGPAFPGNDDTTAYRTFYRTWRYTDN